MVKLEEVLDEEFEKNLAPDEDWNTDADSVLSSDDDEDEDFVPDETLIDRIYALRDVIPPAQRKTLANTITAASSWAWRGAAFSGNTLWILTSSALLLAGPFATAAYTYSMEKDQAAQQYANDALLAPVDDKQGAQAAL